MARYYRHKRSFIPIKIEEIDYKDVDILKRYITETGRIIAGRLTGNSSRQQRELSKAIKHARYLALMPYTDQYQFYN